jgi:hypothetical protein
MRYTLFPQEKNMLKTNLRKAANPDVLLIAKGILKGYIKWPNFFMKKLLFRLLITRKQINKNIPEDIKKLLALVIALYSLLRKRMTAQQSMQLLKVVIIPVGLVKQMTIFRFVEEPDHSFENLIKYSKLFKEEGPMRLNKMEIESESEDEYNFKVKNCIFISVFNKFNFPELCGIFCSVDNATYNVYNADDITFNRGGRDRTIAQGNNTCDFMCKRVK